MKQSSIAAKSVLFKCLLGVVGASVGCVIQWVLWQWVEPSRLIVFSLAVIITSLLGGIVAGFTATAISALESIFFFFPPILQFRIEKHEDVLPIIVFLINGTIISIVCEALQRRERRLKTIEGIRKGEQERLSLMTALEKEKAKLEAVVEHMPAGVIIAEAPSWGWTLRNERNEQVWGDQIPFARNIADYGLRSGVRSDGHILSAEEWPLARSILNGEHVDAEEIQIQRKDGTTRTILASATPIRDETGAIIAAVVVNMDITERKRDEEALRYQLILNRAITEQAAESIFVTDSTGKITFLNREAERVFGFSAQELLGQDIHEMIHHHFANGRPFPKEECPLANGYLRGESVRNCEELYFKKDGTTVPVVSTSSPLLVSNKKIGSILLARDISAQKSAEENIEKSLTETREALRSRDEFISLASHELKTPLTSLKMQTEIRQRYLLKRNFAQFAPDKLLVMVEADGRLLDRLNRLVDDMLDVSRINSGRLSIEPERFDLNLLVKEVVERCMPQCEQAGCELLFKTSASIFGCWDRIRIDQVLTNLLSNAIKYGGKTPITVSIRRTVSAVEIQVRDQGPGIPKGDQERIFQRFERAVTDTGITGLGLGLYIARNIVELHGGKIRVDSTPGKGTTFTVSLPLGSQERNLAA